MQLYNNYNIKSFTCPRKFFMGKKILNNLSIFIENLGDNILFIFSNSILKEIKLNNSEFFKNLKDNNKKYNIELLISNQCSNKEIERLCQIRKENQNNIIVGIGGGNVIDCAKAIANFGKCPLVIVPSVPSNDSPSTSLTVINKDNGEFDSYLFLDLNADIVLADTEILIKSPKRFLSSGIGDAIATYYEAKSCIESKSFNLYNMRASNTALYLSKACLDIIESNVEQAMISFDQKIISEEFENLMEAVVFLSGIGAESGGLSCAHAIANGLSKIKILNSLHGENVAFGLLVQSVLESWNQFEIDKLIKIYLISSLPLTLDDLGLFENKDFYQIIEKIAEYSNSNKETMSHMKLKFNNLDIYNAILKANEFGKKFKKNNENKKFKL